MDLTSIKARIKDSIKRTDTTDADLQYFLDGAVDRLNREVKVHGQIERYEHTTSTDDAGRYISLPPLFRHHYRLRLNTQPVKILEYIAPRLMDSKYSRSGKGRPAWFAVIGDVFELDVTPDTGYKLEIAYLLKFNRLSAADPTNWLLEHAEDILISAAMISAETFYGRDSRLTTWKALYEDQIEELREQETFFGGRISARPAGMVV